MMGHMHAMMMKGMTGTSLVATSDGGVVVFHGNTLTKYDKNLNVVKTAIIADEGMAGMSGMGKKKPCCMGMKKKMMMDQDGDDDNDADDAAPAPANDDHEGHHPENNK